MILPIGDAPNPRGVPYVTYLLIGANVAVYLLVTLPLENARPNPNDPVLYEYVRVMSETLPNRFALRQLLSQLSAYDLFVFVYGWRPVSPSVETLFISMFLHGGLLHLLGNMLFLWIYGDNVEHRFGPVRYLIAYLGTGAGATLFQTALSPSSPIPMIGASGAISGVLGFYFLWFPRNQVRVLWFFPPFFMQVFEISARIVLGFYLILDNLLPFLLARAETGVAHGAHIGGFVVGLSAAWILDRHFLREKPIEYRSPAFDQTSPTGPALIEKALYQGNFEDAATEYFALPDYRGMLSPSHSLDLAQWLVKHGHSEGALIVLRRHLRDYPNGPGLAEACITAGDLLLRELHQPTTAYQYYLAALDVGPPPELAERARRGIAAVESMQKHNIGHLHRR